MQSGLAAKATLALAAALALAGCAAGVRKPDVTLPVAYEAPPGSADLAPAALDRWWTIFDDPTLNDLEDEALAHSPDAKTQTARLLEARATRASDILQVLPTGEFDGSASHKQTTQIGGEVNPLFPAGGPSDDESGQFNVSWELDFLGGIVTAKHAADADFAAARFDVESARASLAANVADSYFEARGLAIQLDDANQTLRIERQLMAIAESKAQRGLGATSDADRVAGDLAQAQSQAESLEAELHAAQRLLLILVGRGPAGVETLPIVADAPDPPPVPRAVPGDLLMRRPDVREADWEMRSATLKTKLAKEKVFPTLTLNPQAGLDRSVSPSVSITQNAGGFSFAPAQIATATAFWSYGVNFVQPVLDIPRLLQDAKAQGARAEQAVAAYEKAVQSAYGDAENSLVRLSADEKRIAVLEDGEARAHRAYEAAKTGYDVGLDDLTSALQAEETWRTVRSDLTAERVQGLRRAVQVYKALGGGWDYAALQPAVLKP